LPKCSPHKYLELIKILKKHDPRFEVLKKRGKGSHRMLYHPDISGRAASFPLICHGDNPEINKDAINDLIRRFNLPNGLL